MSPVPIEVDVSCGESSARSSFRLVLMAPVDPQQFCRQVYDAVQDAIAASTQDPQPSVAAVEKGSVPDAQSDTAGSVAVEPEAPAAPRSRGAAGADGRGKVKPFDPVAARKRAAEAV